MCVFSCFCFSGCLMLRSMCGGFSKKRLMRFSEVRSCLLVGSVVGGCNCPPPMTFQKPCKEPHLKKPTQINSIEKKLLLLLLQPTPPTSCNNQPLQNYPQSRKTAKPHNDNVNTVKNDTQPAQSQEKTPTQKSLHPRLNTHFKYTLLLIR